MSRCGHAGHTRRAATGRTAADRQPLVTAGAYRKVSATSAGTYRAPGILSLWSTGGGGATTGGCLTGTRRFSVTGVPVHECRGFRRQQVVRRDGAPMTAARTVLDSILSDDVRALRAHAFVIHGFHSQAWPSSLLVRRPCRCGLLRGVVYRDGEFASVSTFPASYRYVIS